MPPTWGELLDDLSKTYEQTVETGATLPALNSQVFWMRHVNVAIKALIKVKDKDKDKDKDLPD